MNALYFENGNKFLIASICSMLVLASGCNKEEDPKEHLQRGVEYFEKGEYDKAKLELKTSNQSSKDTAETYYYLALLDEKNRQFKAMKENLIKNIELAPDHTEARLKLGKVHLLFGEIDAAMAQADAVLKAAGDNLEALSLKASVLIRQKKYDEAVAIIDGILKTNPNFTDALSLKALVYMEKEDLPAAIQLIDTAIQADNKNIALYLFKIQLDAKNKNIDAVIDDYKKLIGIYPDNQDFKVTLAKIYAQSGKRDDAEVLLRGLVDAEPGNVKPKLLLLDFLSTISKEKVLQQFQQYVEKHNEQPRMLFDLSSWMVSRGQFEEAKKVLNRVVELEEDTDVGLKAQTLMAKIAFGTKSYDEASKLVDAILKANSNYDDAKIMQARLMLVKEQYDEAIALLNKVLWSRSDSEEAMVLLGQAYLVKGDQKEADKQFASALEVNPASPEALNHIYEKALNTKDLKYAKEILEKAISLRPDNMDFMEKLAKMNLAEKNWDGAEAAIKRINEAPNALASDLATFLRGELYQGKGEWAKAVTEYKSLLEKFPENNEALSNMAECYEKLNKRPEMVAFLTATLAKNTNNLPVGILLSNLYIQDKDYAKADALLGELVRNNPTIPQLYIALASVKVAKNDAKSAISAYQEGLKQSPGHIKLSISLASLYEDQGNYDEAVAIYEGLLSKTPHLEVAKNNLSSLLAEHYSTEDKLKRALELSESFKDSDQPYYRDTYAWALVKSGKVNEGLDILTNIIINTPDVPVFRYHLAVANHLSGNTTVAMSELREAIELGAKKGGFSDQKAAETLLKEIEVKRKGG